MSAATLRGRTDNRRRRSDETCFCRCGWPFAGRGLKWCIGCGQPERRRMLLVRDLAGQEVWLPVPHALARGGRP